MSVFWGLPSVRAAVSVAERHELQRREFDELLGGMVSHGVIPDSDQLPSSVHQSHPIDDEVGDSFDIRRVSEEEEMRRYFAAISRRASLPRPSIAQEPNSQPTDHRPRTRSIRFEEVRGE